MAYGSKQWAASFIIYFVSLSKSIFVSSEYASKGPFGFTVLVKLAYSNMDF